MRIVITDADMAAWTPEQLAAMLEWARSNGIDPNKVRAETGLVIDQGLIAFEEFVLNERGRMQMRHAADRSDVWSEPRTVPMVTGYPPEMASA